MTTESRFAPIEPHAVVKQHLPTRWCVPQEVPADVTAELLQAAVVDGVAEERTKAWGPEYRLAPQYHGKREQRTVSAHLSAAEMAQLRQHAAEQGLSISETIRTALKACGVIT
jgi:hypothetical protein